MYGLTTKKNKRSETQLLQRQFMSQKKIERGGLLANLGIQHHKEIQSPFSFSFTLNLPLSPY